MQLHLWIANVERYFYDNGRDPQRHLDGDTIKEEIFVEISLKSADIALK